MVAALLTCTTLLAACGGSGPSVAAPLPFDDEIASAAPSGPASAPGDEPEIEELTVEEPPQPIPPAMWDRTLGELGPDGEVSLQLALDAFALAIAPIPGSDAEPNEHDPDEVEGTAALTWILQHYQDLDAEQRAVLAEVLSPAEPVVHGRSAAPRRAAAPAPTTGCFGQRVMTADSPGAEVYREQLDELATDLTLRLGGEIELVRPVFLQLDQRELGLGLAYTWGDPGDCAQNSLATCTIHLSPRAQRTAPAETRAILAHELMHCFVFQHLGMTTYDLPAWVGEGIPAWVGEKIAGGTSISEPWWDAYLTHPERPLYARAYDAIGFYSHLDELGADPWSSIVDTLDGFENEPAFEGAGADTSSFLDTWPSGFTRDVERGEAWDTHGPGITESAAEPTTVTIAPNTRHRLEVAPTANRVLSLGGAAEIVTVDVLTGHARLSSDDGTDEVLTGTTRWCVDDGGCECPSGDSPTGLAELDGDVLLAVTGGTDAAALTVTGESIDCDDPGGGSGSGDGDVDECLVGTWSSYAAAVQDTTTGMDNTSLGGGEEIILEIREDGTFTMDFDDSTPVMASIGGNAMGHRTRGVAHGRLTASNGELVVVEDDYDTSLRTTFVGMGPGGDEQRGGIAIATGTYECTHNSLDTEEPTKLGRNIFLFQST